jgi:hypothetical protein
MEFIDLFQKIDKMIADELEKDHPDTLSECGMFYIPWNSFVISLTDLGYPSDWCNLEGHKKLLAKYVELLECEYEWLSITYELPIEIENKSVLQQLRKRKGKENDFSIVVRLP